MAVQDYALLVGISRYKDGKQFPPLDGPLNDVERVRDWLMDKVHGQAVPIDHITTLTTPDDLLKPPLAGWPPKTVWAPNRDGFSKMFNDIAFDNEGKMLRREGRLYLYFSGHGFSLNEDDSPSAALFSADNIGLIHSNLAGTIYAAAVKRAKLFREVVLIMDCCRDVFGNLAYNAPDFNRVENTSSDTVKLYALYAAPRRGKSQERELPDSGGKVVGLMTDAMLRALKEAPSDVSGQVAGRVLTQVMTYNWADWYQVRPMPPAPRGVPPDEGDIYFNSRQDDLVPVTVSISKPLVLSSKFELRSDAWTAVATVKESSLRWREKGYGWLQEIALRQPSETSQQFTMVLPPGPHLLCIGADTYSFDPGASNVVAI